MPLPTADGELIEIDGRYALRIERRFRQPQERVWRALLEPADLAAWHPSPFRGELAVGATLTFDSDRFPDGVVTAYEPIDRLAYRWGNEGDLLWELAAGPDGGTVLTITHTFDERRSVAGYGAGWTVCFERLAALVDGTPDEIGEHHGDGWQQMRDLYAERFDVGPAGLVPRQKAPATP